MQAEENQVIFHNFIDVFMYFIGFLREISCELVERLQESHKILERNNVSLLNQLEEAHLRIENQQKIFDFQINELTEIFEKIKKQTE